MIFEDIISFSKNITPGRILSLDVGKKRTGLAISDLSLTIASPYQTIDAKNTFKSILSLINSFSLIALVIGLPIEMNGTQGKQAQLIIEYAKKLSIYTKLPIYLQDERLSSLAVRRTLRNSNMTRKKQESVDDKMAASYILQIVLDKLKWQLLK